MVIGIGVDIIEIDRIKESIEKYGDSFLNKIYTKKEIDYCLNKSNKYQHLAARLDRKSTRLNSSHIPLSRMPSSA